MKSTYISRPIHLLDVPVPEKPSLKFEYNFFVKDERVSEIPPKLSKAILNLNPREISTKIPRLVRVSWLKVRFDPVRSIERDFSPEFIKQNESEIADEANVLSDSTMLYFQDFDHRNRVGERFEASARLRGVLSGSATDVSAKLNAVTSDTTDGDLIQRYLGIASQSRSLFVQGDSLIEPVDGSAAEQLTIIIDNDYLVNGSRESSMSPVGSSALAVRNNTKVISKKLKPRESKFPTENEIELELGSVEDAKVNSAGSVFNVEHLGYVIDRYEISQNDTVTNKKSIYIRSPGISNYIDAEIKYGTQYVYSVRTLASFYTITVSENGDLQRSRFVASSRPSTFSAIRTEEYIPPLPPADINFRWDYQRAALQIDWSFPTNPQRDIKGWQIFRRSSVNEPFSLVAQLDFDDSVVRTPSAEIVDPSLVKRFKSSTTFYIDPEFNKDSKFIYAICSIDAHALTSNYSMQFLVSFDRIKNRLVKTLISNSGAAKQYPNTFLKSELSLDSVMSSNAQRIRLYFDPEYLQVVDSFDRDLKLLKTRDGNGLYRFMLLNTDRQLQANFDVTIDDLRNLRIDKSTKQF